MTHVPQCFRCKHMIEHPGEFSCPAFDGPIPGAIVFNEHDHRDPYENDHGIRFEQLNPPPVAVVPPGGANNGPGR